MEKLKVEVTFFTDEKGDLVMGYDLKQTFKNEELLRISDKDAAGESLTDEDYEKLAAFTVARALEGFLNDFDATVEEAEKEVARYAEEEST